MAKVSSAPEDAYKLKGSFADGWGEIIGAKALVFQYPPDKQTGRQDPPSLFASLEIQRLQNAEGDKAAEEPSEVLLRIASASKDTGMLDKVHPGNYVDGDPDSDPEDAGDGLGAEGNTLFALADGFQINDKTKWMTFCQSLQEKGFKPAVLKRTYFNDLIGLRAFFKTETRKKFRDDQTTDPTVFVVSEIKRFPYEQKAGKATAKPAASAKATTGAPASKANGAAKPETKPATQSDETQGVSAEDLAEAVVLKTLAPKQKGATLSDVKKLKVNAFMAINQHKPAVPPEMKKAVQEQLGDEEWLVNLGAAHELFQVQEDGKVVFAE